MDLVIREKKKTNNNNNNRSEQKKKRVTFFICHQKKPDQLLEVLEPKTEFAEIYSSSYTSALIDEMFDLESVFSGVILIVKDNTMREKRFVEMFHRILMRSYRFERRSEMKNISLISRDMHNSDRQEGCMLL